MIADKKCSNHMSIANRKPKEKQTIKRLYALLTVVSLLFVSTFVLVGCSSPAKKPDNQCKLYLDILSDKNDLFNKYAISISLDGKEIGSVDNGEEFTYLADITQGEHTLDFCKEGKNKPKVSKTISVNEDISYSCQLKHDGFAIKIDKETINPYIFETEISTTETENSTESAVESSTVESSTENTSVVTEPTKESEIKETGKATEVSETTASSVTGPTVVSENITELVFSIDKDIEIFENGKPFTGIINTNAINEKFPVSDVILISEDTDVATIECTGKTFQARLMFEIKPVSIGETYVCAQTSDGKVSSNRIKVIVKELIEVDSIWIEESLSLNKGDSELLSYEISPEDATFQNITWTSSDTSVATVNNRGYVKAINYGEAEITATTSNGCSATCNVSVVLTQREMTLKYIVPHNQGEFIGKEWKIRASIDDETAKNKETYTFNVGETIVFYCYAEESDTYPDIGDNTEYYTITEDDLMNGFTVEVEVYVTENNGKNAGKSAYFVYTFSFSPK